MDACGALAPITTKNSQLRVLSISSSESTKVPRLWVGLFPNDCGSRSVSQGFFKLLCNLCQIVLRTMGFFSSRVLCWYHLGIHKGAGLWVGFPFWIQIIVPPVGAEKKQVRAFLSSFFAASAQIVRISRVLRWSISSHPRNPQRFRTLSRFSFRYLDSDDCSTGGSSRSFFLSSFFATNLCTFFPGQEKTYLLRRASHPFVMTLRRTELSDSKVPIIRVCCI